MRINKRTAIFAAAAAFAVLAFALSGDESPSAQVQALKADPIASYVPSGGTLVDTDSENEGVTLGKPVFASYTRLFELPSAGLALDDARASAKADGWTIVGDAFELAGSTTFRAGKQLPAGKAELSVTLYTGSRLLPKDVDPPALRVSLRHLRG